MEVLEKLDHEKVQSQQEILCNQFNNYSKNKDAIKAITDHCVAEGIYPFTTHALASYRNPETIKFLLSSTEGEIKNSWINRFFAHDLATRKYIVATFSEQDAADSGVTQGDLLHVVFPELQKMFPFIYTEVCDNTDTNGTIFFTARIK